jgi:hypothetical protein
VVLLCPGVQWDNIFCDEFHFSSLTKKRQSGVPFLGAALALGSGISLCVYCIKHYAKGEVFHMVNTAFLRIPKLLASFAPIFLSQPAPAGHPRQASWSKM